MSPRSPFIKHIHPLYTIWFLYLEPIFALGGTYICLFAPDLFLRGTMPLPAYRALQLSPNPISPLTTMLLTNIGALYFLFAFNEGIVLRLSKEKKVWMGIIIAMLISDVGHIYAVYQIAPERIWQVAGWSSDEWINYGTLIGGMVLRLGFVLGIGRS